MVSAALGFGTTAAFVAFVCAQFICCCTRREPLLSSSPSDFPVDLDRLVRATPRSPSLLILLFAVVTLVRRRPQKGIFLVWQ